MDVIHQQTANITGGTARCVAIGWPTRGTRPIPLSKCSHSPCIPPSIWNMPTYFWDYMGYIRVITWLLYGLHMVNILLICGFDQPLAK